MKQEIIDRVVLLGGKYEPKGESLLDKLWGISFDRSYLMQEFEDYLDDFYDTLRDEGLVLPQNEIECSRIDYLTTLFTPFKEGTDDCSEWSNILSKEAISKVIPYNNPDFVLIGHSDGFPDYYFICLNDENQDNPTVYTTDHEVYFAEIEVFGTLVDFFNLFVTEEEYSLIMGNLIEELRTENN